MSEMSKLLAEIHHIADAASSWTFGNESRARIRTLARRARELWQSQEHWANADTKTVTVRGVVSLQMRLRGNMFALNKAEREAILAAIDTVAALEVVPPDEAQPPQRPGAQPEAKER